MKYKVDKIGVMVATMLLCACQGASTSQPPNDESSNYKQSQWPMFSGPNGNSQIDVDRAVPTAWSVRQNKNVLWRTELPAGGQSGISVWQDDVFFTINKPLNTPQYSKLIKDFDEKKSSYEKLYFDAVKINSNNADFKKLSNELTKAKKAWLTFFEKFSQTRLNNMPQSNHPRVIKKLQSDSPLWKAVLIAEKAENDFIHKQAPLLLTTFKQYKNLQKQLNTKGVGKDIILYCLSASDGKVKWKRTISGVVDTMYNYAFSDATSPTPITDGKQVWVVNATGGMASFSVSGEEIWSRHWTPTSGRPFNKQYDTLSSDAFLFNVEPPLKGDNTRNPQWNYLHAIDKKTGETQWVSSAALTHYNTPMLGKTVNDKEALLIGRGGPHGVPEKSAGLSLLDLEGKTLWNWQAEQDGLVPWGATDIQIWDKNTALWFSGNKALKLYSIDAQTGETKQDYDLTQVTRYVYNEVTQSYQLNPITNATFERQPYTPILVGDGLYYLVRYEPYIGYLNLTTGQHLQLEIPTEVNRVNVMTDVLVWKKMQSTDQLNARGQRHNIEKRSQGDGTQKAFLASPIMVNKKIYFTNAHGLTYVIDTDKGFDEKSLIAVNDLGASGETYSLSSMAYADGVFFQRSLKAIYAFANK